MAVRLPQSVIAQVDAHITMLRTMSPWARVGRSEALRDLILRGLRSLDPQGEPAPVATAEDTPLGQPETSAPAVYVASPVPQADVVQAADTPAPTMAWHTPEASQGTPRASRRAHIKAAIPTKQEHPQGITAAEIAKITGIPRKEVLSDLRYIDGVAKAQERGHYVRVAQVQK